MPYFPLSSGERNIVISLDYSLVPGQQYSTKLHRIDDALAYIQKNAVRFHVDANRVVMEPKFRVECRRSVASPPISRPSLQEAATMIHSPMINRSPGEEAGPRGMEVATHFSPEDHQPPLAHEYQFRLDDDDPQKALAETLAFLKERTG